MTPRNPADRPATEPRTDLEDALRELIRVSKSAGMNAASDFGYLPSTQQADEEEISEAVQSVHAAIEAEAAQGAAPLDFGDLSAAPAYSEGAAPRAEGLDVEKIVRATLLFIDQTTPLSVGEPLIQKAIRYATNLSRLTSKEERP